MARKAASQEDYDQAKAKADKSTAQVDADTASLQQAMTEYDINILAAQAKVDQARADLRPPRSIWATAGCIAPIDGRIGELQVKLGNLVGPAASTDDTTSLVTIQQLDPMGIDLRPLALPAGHHQAGQAGAGGQTQGGGQRPIPTREGHVRRQLIDQPPRPSWSRQRCPIPIRPSCLANT